MGLASLASLGLLAAAIIFAVLFSGSRAATCTRSSTSGSSGTLTYTGATVSNFLLNATAGIPSWR